MPRPITRRMALLIGLVLALSSLGSLATGVRAAQDALECPAPTSATPAGAATAPEATPAPVEFPADGGALTVFAAASLTDAFEEMKSTLEAAHPGLAITYNFGGSQALVTQLNEGAAADVFASANNAQMQAAIDNGSISGEPVPFVRNHLAIVTPADNPAGIAAPADLGNADLRLILAQPEVPVGRYAREAICTMGQDSATFGDDFVARVAANIVSEEEDVRDVLAKVQLGEADAGIVYVSDAHAAGAEVQLIPIPDDVNVVATYPIAAVSGGNQELAAAFIAYVLSADGAAILSAYGFEPIS